MHFEAGELIGISPWLSVDQEMITGFGVATRDPDPMHMDPSWSAKESPYQETIAFGFLTMSLLTRMLYDATGFDPERVELGESHVMNYGFDRLRLVAPVPVDSRIRGVFRTKSSEVDEKGQERVVVDVVVEIEGNDKPAMVAEWVVIHVQVEQFDQRTALNL